MPRPKGKTKVLNLKELNHVFSVIQQHRHPEKNMAIIRLCFDFGMTAKEISNLKISDIATIGKKSKPTQLSEHILIRNILNLSREKRHSEQFGFNITRNDFSLILSRVAEDARSGIAIQAENYYPKIRRSQKLQRILPFYSSPARNDLKRFLDLRNSTQTRLDNQPNYANQPFILTQKNTPYSPNTLQEHIKLILADWSGIKGATSLSGRATLVNEMTKKGIPIKDIQLFLGHQSVGTTALYSTSENELPFSTYDLRKNTYIKKFNC